MRRIDRALVLSGGGSLGAYQAGACLGLLEAGYRPDLVTGTSVGAINAVLLAQGVEAAELRQIWLRLRRRHIARPRVDVWRFWKWQSLMDNSRLGALLERDIDFDAVRRSRIRLCVTAVDLCCSRVKVFHNDELTVWHLLASSAIPGVFPPVVIDGHAYVDGAVVNNTPLRPAVRAGASEVTTVLADPLQPRRERLPRNVPEILTRVVEVHGDSALRRELVKGLEINALLATGVKWADWRPIDFRILTPREPMEATPLQFGRRRARELLARGERDAADFWERHEGPGAKKQGSRRRMRRRRPKRAAAAQVLGRRPL